jgi:hypothetical protein
MYHIKIENVLIVTVTHGTYQLLLPGFVWDYVNVYSSLLEYTVDLVPLS